MSDPIIVTADELAVEGQRLSELYSLSNFPIVFRTNFWFVFLLFLEFMVFTMSSETIFIIREDAERYRDFVSSVRGDGSAVMSPYGPTLPDSGYLVPVPLSFCSVESAQWCDLGSRVLKKFEDQNYGRLVDGGFVVGWVDRGHGRVMVCVSRWTSHREVAAAYEGVVYDCAAMNMVYV